MSDIYHKFTEKYGIDAQLTVAIEEFSELTKCICKYKRMGIDGKSNQKVFENLYEEIADAEIMIEQLRCIFDADNIIDMYKEMKLKRMEVKL